MATEKQYAFFKSLYDEESERIKILAEHAKNNLGLTTLYSAFVLFVIEKEASHIDLVGKVLFCGAIIFLLISFFLSLLATQIADYMVPSEPKEIIDAYGAKPPTDEEFFDARIVDYAIASETNSEVNDRKAGMLLYARYALLAGVGLHALFFVVQIIRS